MPALLPGDPKRRLLHAEAQQLLLGAASESDPAQAGAAICWLTGNSFPCWFLALPARFEKFGICGSKNLSGPLDTASFSLLDGNKDPGGGPVAGLIPCMREALGAIPSTAN